MMVEINFASVKVLPLVEQLDHRKILLPVLLKYPYLLWRQCHSYLRHFPQASKINEK